MNDKTDSQCKKSLKKGDVDLWRQMTSDVVPMPDQGYQELEEQGQVEESPSMPKETVVIQKKPKEPFFKKAAVGLDRRSDDRLRRGKMAIEAQLDLHGFNQEEAYVALRAFIQETYRRGKRCVLVITGKGRTGSGVLRHRVPEWLQEEQVGHLILKTYSARPQHGGDGALYVLLRRKR